MAFYAALGVLVAVVFALAVRSVYQDGRAGRIPKPPPTVQELMPMTVQYLERKAGGGDRHTDDGWTWFCFARYLGNSPVAERFELYIWEGCQQFRRYRNGVAELTGWSVPAVITVSRRGDAYRHIDERQPGDGTHYGPDIRRMFPSDAQSDIWSIPEGTGPGSAHAMFEALKKRARRELT
jgi:hypothetical protein